MSVVVLGVEGSLRRARRVGELVDVHVLRCWRRRTRWGTRMINVGVDGERVF
jgi:hypothetical protein